jgi:23S rRNA maturation-related 3'-5' exoribonuclease YhaM
MLRNKSPNELLEYIQGLDDAMQQYTINLMTEYIISKSEERLKSMRDAEELWYDFDSELQYKEDYSEAREYLKKFQLQKG